MRPNTEFAKSSAETETVDALVLLASSLIACPTIASDTARLAPVSTVAISSLRASIVPASSSRSWNRRFNSLTEILAVRRVASLYG